MRREERGRRKEKRRGDEWWREIPYSAKFSWVFNFVNFTNFPPFAKSF